MIQHLEENPAPPAMASRAMIRNDSSDRIATSGISYFYAPRSPTSTGGLTRDGAAIDSEADVRIPAGVQRRCGLGWRLGWARARGTGQMSSQTG